ncbi:CUB domain-containing protein [Ditylenchus destructor]|uniref:CUB domain-containing protein n=1 Tax=Ditylenchus destructor TaxID=166010 RepID=A0AAD4N0A0_9BILA|nr:CUB domain-containing protein [Ditylenchus destructor]
MLPDDEDESMQKSIDVEDIEFVSIWYHREGDKTNGARKLRIEYEWREKCYCGENELKAELGVWKLLTSPDYPLQYCNNLNCEYRIVADEGFQIALNITDFFTEMNQDSLAIFDGNTTDKEHLQLVSGVELFMPIIRTESNMMTLLFTTDLSITMRGFSLIYTAEKTPVYRDLVSKSTGHSRWSIACVVILVVILGATAVAFLFIRSNRLNVANERGGPAIRFVR